MSDEKKQIGFDDVPESKQSKTINEAGIHRNFLLETVEFQPRANKKEKKKNDKTGLMEEVETSKVIGPWVKLVFKSADGESTFSTTIFAPPVTPDEVKYVSDKYEGGVAIRKNTKDEQIRLEFTKKFYLYEQLAKAVLISPDKFLIFKKGLKAETDVLFKEMYDQFFKQFPLERIKKNAIDFKAVWNNNDNAKTSFLQLADASSNNVVFAPYHEQRESILSVTQWEQVKLKRKYSNNDRAPQGSNTEISKSGNAWKPTENADAFDDKSGAGSSAAAETGDEPLF